MGGWRTSPRWLNCAPQVTSTAQLNKVIFKDKADAVIIRKFTSLFPGLGYAAGYKVSLDTAVRNAFRRR